MSVELEDLLDPSSYDVCRYLDWALETGVWNGRQVSWTEASDLYDEVQEKIFLLLMQNPDSPLFEHLSAQFALIGTPESNRSLLACEIQELVFSKNDLILQVGFQKSLSKFWKKHKKEILIGAAIIAIVTVVVVVAVSTAGTGAGAVVGAGGAALGSALEKDNKHSPERQESASTFSQPTPPEIPPLPSLADDKLIFAEKGVLIDGRYSAYDNIIWNQCEPALPPLEFSTSVFPKFNGLQPEDPYILHQDLFSQPNDPAFYANGSINALSPQASWLNAESSDLPKCHSLSHGTQRQPWLPAFLDTLGKDIIDYPDLIHLNTSYQEIEAKPANPALYLERGAAYFGLGEYNLALEDYHQFTAQAKTTYPVSVSEFSLGFAKGLPKGIYESGRGILMFLTDVATNPVHTGAQMWEALKLLSDLAHSGHWEAMSEVLAPEIHQLVKEWDTTPSDQRGELAGYAFGKYGTDILIPGALAKAVSKGLQGTQELSTIYRGLKTAEKTFLLESASKLETGAKIAEVVKLEKRISEWLGEGTKFIRNEAGDPVFLSKDGLRCVRFDFNYPYPHNNPHAHIEIKVDGKWKKSGQIYPIDIPHN